MQQSGKLRKLRYSVRETANQLPVDDISHLETKKPLMCGWDDFRTPKRAEGHEAAPWQMTFPSSEQAPPLAFYSFFRSWLESPPSGSHLWVPPLPILEDSIRWSSPSSHSISQRPLSCWCSYWFAWWPLLLYRCIRKESGLTPRSGFCPHFLGGNV